jgi:hypothetical protein
MSEAEQTRQRTCDELLELLIASQRWPAPYVHVADATKCSASLGVPATHPYDPAQPFTGCQPDQKNGQHCDISRGTAPHLLQGDQTRVGPLRHGLAATPASSFGPLTAADRRRCS